MVQETEKREMISTISQEIGLDELLVFFNNSTPPLILNSLDPK
ncbi:MAG TPA: hypothetical protein VFP49_04835 [Nitrososphaeraceae archaeon]|nr:hypothetical protein [Nitrososphaeraceae archaeon]